MPGYKMTVTPIIDGDVRVLVDKCADVLYARMVDSEIVNSRECDTDYELIFNLDALGNIIGVTIIGISVLSQTEWLNHSGRGELPSAIVEVIDRYIGQSQLEKDLGIK